MKFTNKWSIRHKILLPAIGGMSVVGLSLFIYFMYAIYGIQNQNLANIANRTVGILKNALEYPVISGNIDDVEGLVDWLMEQPEIESITVHAGDTLLLNRQKESSTRSRYLNTYKETIVTRPQLDVLSPSDEFYEHDTNTERVIGTLTVVVSDKLAEESFIGEAVVAFFIFTPFLVAVIGVALLSIKSTNNDISLILNAINSYRQGDMDTRIKLDQTNDVGQIAYQFNFMAQSIQDKEKSLIEASMLQNRFMSTMSHDLRSPLGIIVASLELTKDRADLPESMKRDIASAMMASRQLLKLIDDLISVNRIAKKGESLTITNVNLNEVIEQSVETIRPSAEAKDLILNYKKAPLSKHEILVRADESKLLRIVNNLLSNAIKFTEEGSVHVQLKIEHIEPNKVKAILVIQDTGIGIPESEFGNIFKPFKRLENVNTASVSGSGLGLSIVAEYLNLMSGQVTIKSQLTLGTSFEVTIPFELASAQKTLSTDKTNVTELRKQSNAIKLLFVDDNDQYHAIIQRMFSDTDLTSCHNGSDAISTFKEREFDVVILDCHMPMMDGFAVAIQMRNIEKAQNRQRTPIIALTANAVPETQEQSRLSGMDDYMTKPFTRNDIQTRVFAWLKRKRNANRPVKNK